MEANSLLYLAYSVEDFSREGREANSLLDTVKRLLEREEKRVRFSHTVKRLERIEKRVRFSILIL